MADEAGEEAASLLSVKSVHPNHNTITKIVKRLRAMTLKLLPLEVEPDSLNDPTSRIITPQVIQAYAQAAGDFGEALPYCLLRARQTFMWEANHNPADFGENVARATACEVLARRIVHNVDGDRLNEIMSTRFRHTEWDGDESNLASALELAVDQHCTIFLSSSEAQTVVNALWSGDWVQQNNAHGDIDYRSYNDTRKADSYTHLDPARLSVPRYQAWFRIAVWVFFLFVYSQSVQQPIDQATDPNHALDEWEIILYVMGLAYAIEDTHKYYKNIRYFNWRAAVSFWNVVSFLTDGLLLAAFILRIVGLATHNNPTQEALYKLRSFQVLSCVAPLIWMKLLTVFDPFKYVGTLQICVSRMLQESTIFIALLSILGLGFLQSMYALDASDGKTEHGYVVLNQLIQALLQSPDFEQASASPIGLTLFYLWNVVTTVILLNVLVSLFSSAYDDVTQDAEAEFMAFFAEKTIGMIRAPDDYVYPAPFNLIESVAVVPFELILTKKQYATYSRAVMLILFWPVLLIISLFESYVLTTHNHYFRSIFGTAESDGEEDDPSVQDPSVSPDTQEGEDGLQISRVPFETLVKSFPNSYQSSEATIVNEIRALKKRMEELLAIQGGEGATSAKKEEQD